MGLSNGKALEQVAIFTLASAVVAALFVILWLPFAYDANRARCEADGGELVDHYLCVAPGSVLWEDERFK